MKKLRIKSYFEIWNHFCHLNSNSWEIIQRWSSWSMTMTVISDTRLGFQDLSSLVVSSEVTDTWESCSCSISTTQRVCEIKKKHMWTCRMKKNECGVRDLLHPNLTTMPTSQWRSTWNWEIIFLNQSPYYFPFSNLKVDPFLSHSHVVTGKVSNILRQLAMLGYSTICLSGLKLPMQVSQDS